MSVAEGPSEGPRLGDTGKHLNRKVLWSWDLVKGQMFEMQRWGASHQGSPHEQKQGGLLWETSISANLVGAPAAAHPACNSRRQGRMRRQLALPSPASRLTWPSQQSPLTQASRQKARKTDQDWRQSQMGALGSQRAGVRDSFEPGSFLRKKLSRHPIPQGKQTKTSIPSEQMYWGEGALGVRI